MRREIKNKFFFKTEIYLQFFLLSLLVFLSSCVRLTGGAGVWKQGAGDETPVLHQASFDTADLVPQSSSQHV